jgi:hypothetical protein
MLTVRLHIKRAFVIKTGCIFVKVALDEKLKGKSGCSEAKIFPTGTGPAASVGKSALRSFKTDSLMVLYDELTTLTCVDSSVKTK